MVFPAIASYHFVYTWVSQFQLLISDIFVLCFLNTSSQLATLLFSYSVFISYISWWCCLVIQLLCTCRNRQVIVLFCSWLARRFAGTLFKAHVFCNIIRILSRQVFVCIVYVLITWMAAFPWCGGIKRFCSIRTGYTVQKYDAQNAWRRSLVYQRQCCGTDAYCCTCMA